jgi:hypothetical protein
VRFSAIVGSAEPVWSFISSSREQQRYEVSVRPQVVQSDDDKQALRKAALNFDIERAGMSLARMEAQVAIGTPVQRFIERAGDFVRGGRARFRGFLHYPLRLRAT